MQSIYSLSSNACFYAQWMKLFTASSLPGKQRDARRDREQSMEEWNSLANRFIYDTSVRGGVEWNFLRSIKFLL